jgi:choline dehydrogenase-like flavoprotein
MEPDPVHDAIVIGSGAGGGASAWALAERGLDVLLLEAGPAYTPETDYRLHRPDWERSRFPSKFETTGRQTVAPLQTLAPRWRALRSWSALRGPLVAGERRQFWAYHHEIGLGGTTLHFTGEAHRLHPAAMRMASRFGVAADWPFDYAALEPYYTEVERLIGVAGPPGDPIRTRSQPYPLPAHPLSYASQKLQRGAAALGMTWTADALAALSAPYDGRPGCNYCGNCTRGCPRRDKGSVDVTFIRRALASGRCTARTGCAVTSIEAGDGDRVRAVEYTDADGAAHRVSGHAVIVACGAIETPRLLLASKSAQAPDGLANESGQVGRNFMETLGWTCAGLHPEPLGSHRGLPSDSICWDFNAPDAIPGVVGGCRFSPATAEADLIGPINYARRVVGGWGREHRERMRASFGRVLAIGAVGESLPNPGSFIDLDPVETDTRGIPKARIHSHLDDRELARLDFMATTCRRILKAAGVEEIFEEYGAYDAFNATHVFGTCRMGLDSASSVVDPFCRSHRWKNLFVVDASVFPSSGGGEAPALTIEALALRTAEHIAALGRRREL